MADTRMVGVGILCTISGNVITFPQLVGGTYTTSNFVINDTKAEGKAISAIGGSVGLYTDVTVASIDTWVATDRYFLALTNQPTLVYASISAGVAAAVSANGDEVVIYPQNTGRGGATLY